MLLAPVGFAALVLLAQAASLVGASVGAISTGLVVLAGLGVAASMPWRFGRPDPWAASAALAAFALIAAPVLLSGAPTFVRVGSEDGVAAWLLGAASDPSWLSWPLAVAQRLLGGEPAWHLKPYLAVLGALLALTAWQLAGRAERLGPRRRAAVSYLAVVPALVFAYARAGRASTGR
jgi:hypothetical protein